MPTPRMEGNGIIGRGGEGHVRREEGVQKHRPCLNKCTIPHPVKVFIFACGRRKYMKRKAVPGEMCAWSKPSVECVSWWYGRVVACD